MSARGRKAATTRIWKRLLARRQNLAASGQLVGPQLDRAVAIAQLLMQQAGGAA